MYSPEGKIQNSLYVTKFRLLHSSPCRLSSRGWVPLHVLADLACMAKETHYRCQDKLGRVGQSKDDDMPPAHKLRPRVESDPESNDVGNATAGSHQHSGLQIVNVKSVRQDLPENKEPPCNRVLEEH